MTERGQTLTVLGESFRVEREDGVVYLCHPQWSLLGSGQSVEDALQDMRLRAAELADMPDDGSPSSPAYDAMIAFSRRIKAGER